MLRFSLLLLCVFLPLGACAIQPQESSDNPAAALSSAYPKLQYQLLNPTPVSGVYEVVTENEEVLYFVPASGHIFTGDLWSADGHNLTAENRSQRMTAKLKLFPLDKAIKIGDGPNQVVEVTDPDCPFCRHSSDYFAGRDDVTRYVFLFPLGQVHPNAIAKSRFILAADDPEQAYEDVFSGMYDHQPVPDAPDDGRLQLFRDIAHKAGVNGTPHFWINGQHVTGYNPQQFDALLNK
ncbi:thiol:disulfide interchange protein DsbC [Desulfuromusa kysingii]|uniref:Thiol:disulfide interchange protein DsbC n=1 Tax=Desulfuromusa kysingii TaxID=37625 RepID=A0A1H4E8G4_9BACT|nr:DsbC family protein [Desulfuromusa kysingii]SEA80632.1 thiol:disulfide interchange protein DsbC [Desulfuromusa kysingii]